jgi:hypothetical protein
VYCQKQTQEAKNKVIYSHKYVSWTFPSGPCIYTQQSILGRDHMVCVMFFHFANIQQFKNSKLFEYFHNQDSLHQLNLLEKIKILHSLEMKILLKTKKDNGPLDRSIDRVTMKILHSLNAQFTMRHEAAQFLREFVIICIMKILVRRHVSTKLMCSCITARRHTHTSMTLTKL